MIRATISEIKDGMSAYLRRVKEGESVLITEVARRLVRLRALSEIRYEVQPDRRVKDLAQRLLRVHPLRAADSFQLAAALAVVDQVPTNMGFVCFDAQLNRAASREGLRVLVP